MENVLIRESDRFQRCTEMLPSAGHYVSLHHKPLEMRALHALGGQHPELSVAETTVKLTLFAVSRYNNTDVSSEEQHETGVEYIFNNYIYLFRSPSLRHSMSPQCTSNMLERYKFLHLTLSRSYVSTGCSNKGALALLPLTSFKSASYFLHIVYIDGDKSIKPPSSVPHENFLKKKKKIPRAVSA